MALVRPGIHLADAGPAGPLEDRVGCESGAGQGPADPLASERLDIRGRITDPQNPPLPGGWRGAARQWRGGREPGGAEAGNELAPTGIGTVVEEGQQRVDRPPCGAHRGAIERRGNVDPTILEADQAAVPTQPHAHPEFAGGKVGGVGRQRGADPD